MGAGVEEAAEGRTLDRRKGHQQDAGDVSSYSQFQLPRCVKVVQKWRLTKNCLHNKYRTTTSSKVTVQSFVDDEKLL